MTDVFISYAREDRDWVEKLSGALEAAGIAVWWDRQLAGGAEFHKETEARLNAAKAIVVAWSKASIDSMWVSDEATVGREKGTLIPIAIEAVTPKLGFRGLHTIDLARWKGNRTAPEFVDLVRALKTRISGEVPSPMAPVQRRPWSKRPPVLAAIGAVLLVGLGLLAYWQLAPSRATPTAQPASATGAPAAGSISVAVLPFDNLSGDASQEFFSNGITEEITAVLAKVSGLKVVARTSAFQFKAQHRDIQSIGQQLHATHFIEGSVQKAGDQVRITAQLIKADDATHLWAETYNRKLTDIFAIQDDIAKAIAGALRVPLGLKGTLVANRTQDPESYQQYLQAKTRFQRGGIGTTGLTEVATLLEQAVARDPDFAPAWALLSEVYALMPGGDPAIGTLAGDPARLGGTAESVRRRYEGYVRKAVAAARRAIELDPNDPRGHAALSQVQANRFQLLAAAESISKALALDPQNSEALNRYSLLLATVGHLKEALSARLQLQALEPFVPAYNTQLANILWLNGKYDAALDMLKLAPGSFNRSQTLARIYAAMGRYGDAADALLDLRSQGEAPAQAAGILRAAPAVPKGFLKMGPLTWVYLYTGAPERSIEGFAYSIDFGYALTSSMPTWHSSYAAVRKTARFKALVRKAGLIDYWRAKGWPEFCQPVGKDDFACH